MEIEFHTINLITLQMLIIFDSRPIILVDIKFLYSWVKIYDI